jgi:hypothetical protein
MLQEVEIMTGKRGALLVFVVVCGLGWPATCAVAAPGHSHITPLNALLSGTGLTFDRYEGPRLDGIGCRVEPPLGIRIRGRVIRRFLTTVLFAGSAGAEPWGALSAESAPPAGAPGLQDLLPWAWTLSLSGLPAGGLLLTPDHGSGPMWLRADDEGLWLESAIDAGSPYPGGPGLLWHRMHDHIGDYICVVRGNDLLMDTGISIVAEAKGSPQPSEIALSLRVEPAGAPLDADAWSPAFAKIDFVTGLGALPWATMDCPGPCQAMSELPLPYVLEIHGLPEGGLRLSYDGTGYLLSETADAGLQVSEVQ